MRVGGRARCSNSPVLDGYEIELMWLYREPVFFPFEGLIPFLWSKRGVSTSDELGC